MNSYRKIRIPFALARYAVWQRNTVNKYQTNRVIRALDAWLVLKHETRSGLIRDYATQLQYLCKVCKVSPTVLRSRLKMLADMKAVTIENGNLLICSWKQLARILQTSFKLCYDVQYNLDDPKQKLHLWIAAVEIADNQHHQELTLKRKLHDNPAARLKLLESAVAAGADPARLNEWPYFLVWLQSMYLKTHLRASHVHDLLISHRPELNRSVYGIARAWCAKSAQTASYWKGKMYAAGVVHIGKLTVRSEQRARNKYVNEKWNPRDQQTFFTFCDNILLLDPIQANAANYLSNLQA